MAPGASQIEPARLKPLNQRPAHAGRFVLYWMQAAQRAEANPALEFALEQANELRQPLFVVFGLTGGFPEANERHYRFMLEGLRETQATLNKRGVRLFVLHGSPPEVALKAAREASLLVTDRGYLRVQKQWREEVARQAPCAVVQVETEVVVPVEVASDKEEWAARTIRPKLHRALAEYLRPPPRIRVAHQSTTVTAPAWAEGEMDLRDIDRALRLLRPPSLEQGGSRSRFTGGARAARQLLDAFISRDLRRYEDVRGEPAADASSHLSPYLHFGQISPVAVALAARDAQPEASAPFLEQLIVRRELAMNFAQYDDRYDEYDALPDWCQRTLRAHREDPRPVLYGIEQLESARTADEYWNAAMREMIVTGFMPNVMRMYWGKKIIEWSPTPEEAFARTLRLNNKYFVDGRDPVSFANVAWCFGKHDQPFPEREVFGTVRYMSAGGLKRKHDMPGYLQRVATLEASG